MILRLGADAAPDAVEQLDDLVGGGVNLPRQRLRVARTLMEALEDEAKLGVVERLQVSG